MRKCIRCSGQMLQRDTLNGLMWICSACSHDEAVIVLRNSGLPSLDVLAPSGRIVHKSIRRMVQNWGVE